MSSEPSISQPEPQPPQPTASIDPSPSEGVNLERKARKEAQKALKAAQAAEKKAATAAAAAAARAAQQQASSSTSKPAKEKAPRKPQSSQEQLSRALAYILRHGAEKEGLTIRPDGYIALQDVLQRPRVKSVNMAQAERVGAKTSPRLEDVKRIVENNDKKRFELTQDRDGEWWVRAVQGHSLKSVVELEHVKLSLDNLHLLKVPATPEDALTDDINAKLGELQFESEKVQVIHGTNATAWQTILASGGLKPMTRNHIHLAKGKSGQEGVVSGMRKSANRLIYIDIVKAMQDGIEFVLSSNGVVLTEGDRESGMLGKEYFIRVEDQSGQLVWSPSDS